MEGRRYRKLPASSTKNQHVEQPRETYTEEGTHFCNLILLEQFQNVEPLVHPPPPPCILHDSKLVQ